MYASRTDYESLYSPAYFGKGSGVASFDSTSFCDELLRLCAARGWAHVVDVGSGSGALAQQLRARGMDVLSCDFDPASPDSLHFDLSGPKAAAQELRGLIGAHTGGRPWLLTCLDVLEHIDPEDVAAAIRNLRIVCSSEALLSISTRPSSRDNRYHATIIPMGSWTRMLAAAGLRVEDDKIFPGSRQVRREFPSTPDLCLVSHWAKVDPFKDISQGEPGYLLLSATEPGSDLDLEATVDCVLDIGYRGEKRRQFDLVDPPRIGLNIHHIQDFILLRPLLDVLQRDKTVVLMRTSALQADELSLIRGFCGRSGVKAVEFERTEKLEWAALDIQWLLSGGESSVAPSHILSRQVVEAAKLNGVRTLQMQHGIWRETFAQRLIEFGSDVVLAWDSKYADFFRCTDVELAGRVMRVSQDVTQQFKTVGSAKYTDALISPSNEVLRWRLGIDACAYRRVVLLGTNLRWGRHRAGRDESQQGLARVIDSNPDVFFLVKLHPSERAPDFLELARPNSIVLDDIILGSMDLTLPRLLAGVDVVASSLSTLLLDAAVAGKPCIQYDTRNDYTYASMKPVALGRLSSLLADGAEQLAVNDDLVSHYADAAREPFYRNLSDLLRQMPQTDTDVQKAGSFYSVAATVENLHDSKKILEATCEARERELAALEAQNLQSRNECEMARAEIAALEAQSLQSRNECEMAQAEIAQHREREISMGCEIASLVETIEAEVVARHRGEADFARQIASLTGSIEIERAASREAAARLGALQASKSWRITAPLRRLRALL